MRDAEEEKESERSKVRSDTRARNFLTFPPPASRLPPPASRLPPPASRLPPPASRIPHPASRIPPPASVPVHIYNRLREALRIFLRHVVTDTVQHSVRIFAGELAGVRLSVSGGTIEVAGNRDGGDGDIRTLEQFLLEVAVRSEERRVGKEC